MTALIRKVISIWQGADGSIEEVIEDGSPLDAMTLREGLKRLKSPKKKISTHLILDDGSCVKLPFSGSAYILPGRTGVIALFRPSQYVCHTGEDRFPEPHNAAVFNSDGGLRFQVINPHGKGWSFFGFDGNTFDVNRGSGEFRVSVRSDDPRADFVHSYLFDGASAEIKDQYPLNIRL